MKTIECIKWLWKASEGVRVKVLCASFAGSLHVGVSLAFVWFCKSLIDSVTSDSSADLTWLIAGLVICLLFQILFSTVELRLTAHADIMLKNRLRYRLFQGMMESKWNGQESFHTGDALNRIMEDVRVVAESVAKSVPAVIISAVQFVSAFVFLFILSPGLAWAVPGLMLVMLVLSKRYILRMRRLTKDIRAVEGDMHSLMQESLQHRLVIHTLERTPYITDSFSDRQDDLKNQVLGKTDYSLFARAMVQAGFSSGYAAAFLWGVFGIRNGTASFGMVTAFLQLVGQIQRPIMNLSRQLPVLINSLTAAERLSEISSLPSEKMGESLQLGQKVGVRFDNVDFSYQDSSEKVLSSFTYDFKPGSTTAVLGETGVGKSTMMRLILSLLEPDSGDIVMYNDELSVEVSPQTRCNIVYVPQGNTLMSGTIKENLLLGDPDADESELRAALTTAAAEFVYDLPEGLETICGEKGQGLSEGQAQRIAIARALLRKGGILLMDEPTASLDSNTESILVDRLQKNLRGRTLILVTHRHAAANLCQNILEF